MVLGLEKKDLSMVGQNPGKKEVKREASEQKGGGMGSHKARLLRITAMYPANFVTGLILVRIESRNHKRSKSH
jgi:hypothetical protein